LRTRALLYIAPWIDLGGTSRAAVDWFETLDRDRFRALAVTTLPSSNRALHSIVPHAEEIWALPDLMPGALHARFLLDLVRGRGVEVIHVSNTRLPLTLLPELAALPRPPRVVVQLHDAREEGLNRYVATRYDSLVDAYSLIGPETAAVLEGMHVSPGKLHVIPLGIDLDRFAPDTDPSTLGEGFHVLWPARLAEQKDPLLMAEVARRLHERVPDAVMHVVGAGPLEEELRATVASCDGAVRLHGAADPAAMPALYAAADAVLLTSLYEGVPLTLAEGLAMARPVVAPALSGVRALADEACALLVEPRDDVESYVTALMRLADDADLRGRLGAAGRERVEQRFDRQTCARRHAELYEELLG
jgi:glycosyltransferase involved in cell wall biosynthesis